MSGKLEGKTILVPERRELDLFAGMLEAQGARAIRCPLVTILDAEDSAPVEAWLKRLVRGEFDDLILLTGEGLRRLLAVGEHLGMRDDIAAAIGRLRTIVRGPKPVRALREIGLQPGLIAASPTSAGIVDTLSAHDLRGRKIGLQLYPGEADPGLLSFLDASGAVVFPVTPYRYASDSDTGAVADAIRKMASGGIDVIAFTSSAQIRRLLAVAAEAGLEQELAEGWKRTRVASIGPVVGDTLKAIGVEAAAQPASGFHMKPLAAEIVRLFNASCVSPKPDIEKTRKT
jgi:uroporphyrinogen-III synthase